MGNTLVKMMPNRQKKEKENFPWDVDEAYAQGKLNGLQDRHHSICRYGANNTLADVWWLGWRHGSIKAQKRHLCAELDREIEEAGMKAMQAHFAEHPEDQRKDL